MDTAFFRRRYCDEVWEENLEAKGVVEVKLSKELIPYFDKNDKKELVIGVIRSQ